MVFLKKKSWVWGWGLFGLEKISSKNWGYCYKIGNISYHKIFERSSAMNNQSTDGTKGSAETLDYFHHMYCSTGH